MFLSRPSTCSLPIREDKFSNTFGKTPVTLRVDRGYYKISSPGNRILKRHFGNIDTAVLDLRQDYEMADYLPNEVFSINIFIEHVVTFMHGDIN